jgi:hypothetical protein
MNSCGLPFAGLALSFASLLVVSACASTSISLDSAPEKAVVTVKPLGGGASKTLGETPLTVKSENIETEFSGSGPLMVEFSKEGYKTKSVLITELSSMNINLKVSLEGQSGIDDPATMNAQIEALFEAQRLVRVRRFDEAMKLISGIKRAMPTLSSSYELEGGVYYMNGRYQDALDSYRQAVKLNPKSVEAVRMRDMLAKNQGAPDSGNARPPAAMEGVSR